MSSELIAGSNNQSAEETCQCHIKATAGKSCKITDEGRNVKGCRQTRSLNFKEENSTWDENDGHMSLIFILEKKNRLDY